MDEQLYPEDEIVGTAAPRLRFDTSEFRDGVLLTGDELSLRLGCSLRTLARMVRRRELPPPTPLAGRKVWEGRSVKEWLTRYVRSGADVGVG